MNRASTPAVTFDSQGVTLAGLLHLPAGPGPHPVVVFLQGFPGNERSLDLAQALRAAGYATLVFHYRGSWGMGGTWSWSHALADAAAVTRAVRQEPFATGHRLDPGRVALFGHSFGGFAALMTAAALPEVRAVVSVSAFDFGTVARSLTPGGRDGLVEAFDGELLPLRGTSGEALVAEMEAAGERWSLAGLGDRLADRPVMLIGTSLDDVTPAEVHHRPLAESWSGWVEQHEWATDHALSDHRALLIDTVHDFVDRHL
ncbi:alpha/beta hydrolase family protein [Nonomuraea sp. NPDC050536]|uniref:alpha/beta hydrolase family protein n=1 Tax=Nonomuraea sp. NPDC050536 TaxID=3364366 RepID=UPI0037CBA6CA